MGGTFLSLFFLLQKQRSASGMSLQSLIAIVTARALHMTTHWISGHYRPQVLPSWPYIFIDFVNVGLGGLVLASFTTQFYRTYDKDNDTFGVSTIKKMLPKSGLFQDGPVANTNVLYSFVAVVAFLWCFVRQSQKSFFNAYFLCYYEVMSVVALLPQLAMFHKDKRVSPLLANFVVLTALNRACTFCFWFFFPWVFPTQPNPPNRTTALLTEAFNILICSDFLYYWVRSKARGDKEVILGDFSDFV